MRLFNPYLYYPYHLFVVSFFTLLYFLQLNRRSVNGVLRWKPMALTIIYALVFTVIVGLRPVHGAFGDTVTVANTFRIFKTAPITIIGPRDAFFYYMQWFCAQRMDINSFLLICEVLYVVPMVIACRRLMKNGYDIAVIFCLAAFSFFTYGTNGIRSGIATSLVLLALSLIQGNVLEKVICFVIAFIAVNFHRSTTLPVLCMFIVAFFKPGKLVFYFWLLSIVLSLVAGGPISSFFASLGFDDRLDQYINAEIVEGRFSRTGFRWDFLLYSSMPILLGYYLIFKKKISDLRYDLLLGTYILSNSFWIMVIRAEYSNRFAYLSWFLYPLVLAYPLIRLKIWPRTQGQKVGIIMVGHLAFTLLMKFVF